MELKIRSADWTIKVRPDFGDKLYLFQCHKTLHSEAFLLREPSKEETQQGKVLRELSISRY